MLSQDLIVALQSAFYTYFEGTFSHLFPLFRALCSFYPSKYIFTDIASISGIVAIPASAHFYQKGVSVLFSHFVLQNGFKAKVSAISLMLLRPDARYAIFKIQRGKPQAATSVIMLSYCTIAVTIRGSGGYFRLPLKIS